MAEQQGNDLGYAPRPLSKTKQRDIRVLELVAQGKGFDEIAALTGYAGRSGAWKAYQRALKAHDVDLTDAQRRTIELHRLDLLTDAVWPAAMRGELGAVREASRLHSLRSRLLGLSVAPHRSSEHGGRGGKDEDGPGATVTPEDEMERLREERAQRKAEREGRA